MLPILRNSPAATTPFWGGPTNRLDAFFDRFLGEDGLMNESTSILPVSIWEDDDRFRVEAEVPGMTDRDVEVTVHNGLLYIRGERKPAEGKRYLYNARSYGRFERVIKLPDMVDTEQVEAELSGGILSVTFSKSPAAKPKSIQIKTS